MGSEGLKSYRTWIALSLIGMVCLGISQAAEQTNESGAGTQSSVVQLAESQETAGPTSNEKAPITITLQDALARAKTYSPQFQSAVTAVALARENRLQSKASLLPSGSLTTQYLGTQGNGVLPSGRFVTNDGVHVYRAWAVLHGDLSANTFTRAGYRRADATVAMTRAQEEIARRGLAVTVTQAYYGLVVAQRKYAAAQRSLEQAKRFLQISSELERGGEVAHSDVIKFQIQRNQQQQAFAEATLAMQNARLSLAVLLFPDFNRNFTVVDDLDQAGAMPTLDEVRDLARRENPQLRVAMAAVKQAGFDVSIARSAFLPTLSFDVDYGIEANAFALESRVAAAPQLGVLPNLGYFATVSLNLPVWDWGARRSKLRQADFREKQARVELTFAQRQLVSQLYAYYNEAKTAQSEVSTLRDSADLAAESLRLNTLRYRTGEATVLEVVDAQNTLTQAIDAYADGQSRYRVALANLQTLTGPF